MRLFLISCDVFYREMCSAAAGSVNQVDMEFVPKGLHDIGAEPMLERLQEKLDAVDETLYDAVLFGYGLCNNGLAGLTARTIPIVIPRTHDCIALFMGSKERYREYFDAHPGVYFITSGWSERGEVEGELKDLSIQNKMGMNLKFEQLVEKYGEENAQYLMDTLGEGMGNYGQYTYIEMGIEPDDRFEREARELAEEKDWKFEKMEGDMTLIRALVDGPWDEERFLVVPPGRKVVAKYDERIIAAGDDQDA